MSAPLDLDAILASAKAAASWMDGMDTPTAAMLREVVPTLVARVRELEALLRHEEFEFCPEDQGRCPICDGTDRHSHHPVKNPS